MEQQLIAQAKHNTLVIVLRYTCWLAVVSAVISSYSFLLTVAGIPITTPLFEVTGFEYCLALGIGAILPYFVYKEELKKLRREKRIAY